VSEGSYVWLRKLLKGLTLSVHILVHMLLLICEHSHCILLQTDSVTGAGLQGLLEAFPRSRVSLLRADGNYPSSGAGQRCH
jgi:hypothetical protein